MRLRHINLNVFFLLERLHGLSGGIVSDVRLHEQPTGLNPVQRTALYTKKLTWHTKPKPPHSFMSATSASNPTATKHRLHVGSSSARKGMCVHVCMFHLLSS